ncbi:MAG: DUF6884 domain-containing protein [Candidatus Helarchaeota archaeon]
MKEEDENKMKYSNKKRKVLVITSCSKKKRNNAKNIRAIDLYEGDFFRLVVKFAKYNNFDLKIISSKYGLINPEDKISSYNMIIKSNESIQKLRERVIPKLKNIIKNYDKILLLLGANYRKVIEPIMTDKFITFFDKRGLGGYKSLINFLLKLNKKDLYKLIYKEWKDPLTINKIKNICIKYKALV